MMMSSKVSMGDFNLKYNEGFFNETDGLVPTTVGRQATDYEGTFYQQFDQKGMASGNTSGTNTPSAYSDDPMDLLGMSLDYATATMPTYELNTHGQTNTTGRLTDCSSLGASEESGEDEDQQTDKNLPEILRRPVKGMTSEDKKLRRRELNRLAAQRSRQKKRSNASTLEQEAKKLTKRNAQLRDELLELEKSKASLYNDIKRHFNKCGAAPNSNNNNRHQIAATKQEATACRVSKAPTMAADHGSVYGNRSVGISGMSQGYSQCVD